MVLLSSDQNQATGSTLDSPGRVWLGFLSQWDIFAHFDVNLTSKSLQASCFSQLVVGHWDVVVNAPPGGGSPCSAEVHMIQTSI